MDLVLDAVEARILGALMEKEKTTPEYYPLTLNALMRACNQKNNRDPVMDMDEKTIAGALDGLGFHKKLTKRVLSEDSRVPRYRHDATDVLNLMPDEFAALCVLLLRGPQTLGEIRGRTERLYAFESLEAVEAALQRLSGRDLVKKLPRQMGRKEARYAHLLCGDVDADTAGIDEPAVLEIRADNERIAALEQEVLALKEEVEHLKEQFAQFRREFE